MIDTHAHLNDGRLCTEIPELLDRAKENGVKGIILASADMKDSREEMEIVRKYHSAELALWCTVGVHPHEASTYSDDSHEQLRDWLDHRIEHRIVALGEIGLDYYYDHSPREIQRAVFRRQLELAYEADIPFVLHLRDAVADTLDILGDFQKRGALRSVPGVCHNFSESVEVASILLGHGLYLGFDGPLTFKNSRKAPEVVEMAPFDRLLIETDAPYLTPVPYRGTRNEPSYVRYVLEKMAQIKGVSIEEADRITTENTQALFGCE